MVAQLQDAPIQWDLVVEKWRCDGMADAEGELEHLELREVLLERVLELQAGNEVVEVHQAMHKAVDPSAEECGAIANVVVKQQTPNRTDGEVVVDVQEGDLAILLAEHHPDGIKHIEVLCQVVHKDPELDIGNEFTLQIEETVEEVRGHGDGHGDAKDDLSDVVNHHGQLWVVGFTVLHELLQGEDDHNVAQMAADDRLKAHKRGELGVEAHVGQLLSAVDLVQSRVGRHCATR